MAQNKSNKKKKQQAALVRIVLMVAILICANILASYLHTGLDLTKEKRFTLSKSTKSMLQNMKEVAVIDVYLQGKFPAAFQRLQEAVRERLTSFKDIAGTKIMFRFIDPLEGKSIEDQKQIYNELGAKGVIGRQLNMAGDEEYSMKLFFPYALVHYAGKEMPVLLTESRQGMTPEEEISYSEAMLEYKFASAINNLSRPGKPHVAYIVGNGEELNVRTVDMLTTIPQYYNLDTLDLTRGTYVPLAYDAIIICHPTIPFTEPQKLKLDQYVMGGGHILWSIDMLSTPMDSLQHSPEFMALDYNLNLDDMLFKYGVRVNSDLVEDMACVELSRITGMNGGKPVLEKRPWMYFPKLNPTSEHPIVRNMDFILSKFANSIDTIPTPDIKKTILLTSSKYSRTSATPVRVSLSMMNYDLKPEMFNKPYRPVAVLLEGPFRSVYQNRLAPEYLHILKDSLNHPFKAKCDSNNSMIVISDGDVFTNDYSTTEGVREMGYWFEDGHYYANKNLLLNCLEYLTDKSGLLEARSKDVKLRLLDAGRAKDEKTTWQVVNLAIPVGIVVVFGMCYFFFRKRRYEIQKN